MEATLTPFGNGSNTLFPRSDHLARSTSSRRITQVVRRFGLLIRRNANAGSSTWSTRFLVLRKSFEGLLRPNSRMKLTKNLALPALQLILAALPIVQISLGRVVGIPYK